MTFVIWNSSALLSLLVKAGVGVGGEHSALFVRAPCLPFADFRVHHIFALGAAAEPLPLLSSAQTFNEKKISWCIQSLYGELPSVLAGGEKTIFLDFSSSHFTLFVFRQNLNFRFNFVESKAEI
jgi:hypothetical protein